MAKGSSKPSRGLGFITVVFTSVAVFFAVRTFGFLAGVLGTLVVVDGTLFLLAPQKNRKRAYLSIALSMAVAVVSNLVLSQQMNVLRKWEGVESPALAFTTIEGRHVELSELRGKRVVLNFWATWCGPCRVEIPEINRLVEANRDSDVAVFGLANEGEDTIRQFLAEQATEYPLASVTAGQLPSPYRDIMAVPTTFILDRKGIIQFVRAGYIAGAELQADAWDADDYQGPVRDAPPHEANPAGS